MEEIMGFTVAAAEAVAEAAAQHDHSKNNMSQLYKHEKMER